MSYHSKIYHEINSDRKAKRSFGCNSFSKIRILVGRSKNLSYPIGNIYTTMEELNIDGREIFRYTLKYNGEILNVVDLDTKEEIFEDNIEEIPNFQEKKKLQLCI